MVLIKMKANAMFILILITFLLACGNEKRDRTGDDLTISYKLKSRWKHDPQAWTQGLLIHQGKLFESTGQKQSYIGIVDIASGKTEKKVVLDDQYFGEGITILNNKLYQLTWQSHVGFVYDAKTFEKIREFSYPTEGWGLTHDNHHLIMTDGTEKLIYLDTVTLKPVKTIQVKDKYGFATKLNELEYMEGFILANQWESNRILKIDPQTGMVVGSLDLTPLVQEAKMDNPRADVLNGIAYHTNTKLLIVTGKLWPSAYVLQLNQ
ncbi:MAG: glutaminyl-peptide cyclotransferase [Cyclobacteriaceae bacterium]